MTRPGSTGDQVGLVGEKAGLGPIGAVRLVATGVAAPTLVVVATMVLPALPSVTGSDGWYALVDGLLGRVVIPLGWIWAALVPIRLLLNRTQSEAPAVAEGRR